MAAADRVVGLLANVWTATLEVTGDDTPAALRRLITQTGWQVYAPMMGRVLTAKDLKR